MPLDFLDYLATERGIEREAALHLLGTYIVTLEHQPMDVPLEQLPAAGPTQCP
jgi:hypothetical protein